MSGKGAWNRDICNSRKLSLYQLALSQMGDGTICVHLHLVSDATGETIHSVARARLA